MITRRTALKKLAAVSLIAGPAAGTWRVLSAATPSGVATAPSGIYTVTALPYPYDALEPHIDAKTMEIHHDRHHATYISNLNKAVAGNPALINKPLEELIRGLDSLPEGIRTAVRNNGGGHANHSLFWQMMKKGGGGEPEHQLGEAITKTFGNFQNFKEEFSKAAINLFGSGWAWLSMDSNKALRVETTPNQDSPIMAGRVPVLAIDVWEHAYYLKYQNKRADYVAAFFNVIDWRFVEQRYRRSGA